MKPEGVKSKLCEAFCDGFHVAEVPDGLLVETPFTLPDGDHMDFLIRSIGDGLRLEDDGQLVAEAIASGVDLLKGSRRVLLNEILEGCGVNFDEDEGYFFTEMPSRTGIGPSTVRFVEALLRARDVAMLTKERVASSFADDLEEALVAMIPQNLHLSRSDPMEPDNPADIVVFSKNAPIAFVYAITSTEKLLAALVRHLEISAERRTHSPAPRVFAPLESIDRVSKKRFIHAQNRGLAMPIADGDAKEPARYIAELLEAA